jgi:hypothetical protein
MTCVGGRDNLKPEMAAKPKRGKLEGFQRINMIGFTERLERFGRAKAGQEINWCGEERRFSKGAVMLLLLLKRSEAEVGSSGGLGTRIEGCQGEREKNWGPGDRNYVAPGTEADTLTTTYNGASVLHCSAWLAPASIILPYSEQYSRLSVTKQ